MRASVRLTLLVTLGAVAAACSGSPATSPRAAGAAAPAAIGAGADRSGHVAVLLPDGTVLVAGGRVGSGAVQTAERFDPATGLVTPTGGLNHPHVDAAAVLLDDGAVMVIGGEDGSGNPSASTELYDPELGTFVDGADLQVPRAALTATRLSDGTVMAVGGLGVAGALASTEHFDPSGNEGSGWFYGPPLQAARAHHTTTLLPLDELLVIGGEDAGGVAVAAHVAERLVAGSFADVAGATPRAHHTATLLGTGDVLVVGGRDATGELSTAELYASGAFTATGGLAYPRADHTATLLPDGRVVIAGGEAGAAPVGAIETYRPAAAGFNSFGSARSARVAHTATLLASGHVLLVGGGSSTPELLDRTSVVDTDTWTALSPGTTAVPRHGHTATLLTSAPYRILVVGGAILDNDAFLRSSQLVDPTTGAATGGPDMNGARAYHTATLLPDGTVLVAGGYTGPNGLVATAEVFDGTRWTTVGSMSAPRAFHTATLLANGMVLVAGGQNDAGALATAELYDPAARTFSAPILMNASRSHHAAALLTDGRVLLAGGEAPSAASSAELFDPAAGSFTPTAAGMNASRTDLTATTLASGEVLIAGGKDPSGGTYQGSAELFTPSSGTFAPTANGPIARAGHTATLLYSGEVLFAGGEDGSGARDVVERFDPATGRFLPAASLTTGRTFHTTTLTPAGKVLAWGESVYKDIGHLGERYEPFSPVRGVPPDLDGALPLPRRVPGAPLNLSAAAGASFLGDSEAAGGDSRSSAVNHPVVALERQGGDGLAFARVTRFTSGSATALLPEDLLPGWWWARVIVAGIPGKALPFFVLPPFHIFPDPAGTPPRGSLGFTATGGSGTGYLWSISTNLSGGTIDGGTGAYTAGTTGGVTDVVQVEDSSGNVANVDVVVGPGVTITPADPLIPPRGSVAFTAAGGSGDGWQWSFATGGNLSGGTIDQAGAYQAGPGSGVVDVIQVQDSLGNVATTTITVTAPLTADPVGPLTVFPGQRVHFGSGGGSGLGMTWTLPTNGSGGTVVPVDGTPTEADYTAGRTGNSDDVLHVQDSVGNSVEVQIHVLPGITIDPSAPSTPPGGALSFAATGGSGTGYVWSLLTDRSGAAIDAGTGAYTAGHHGSVSDVVRVTDDLGNVAQATITVGPGITVTPVDPGAYPGETVTLVAQGGSGTGYAWTMVTSNSVGGSIDAGGVYTAGTKRGALDVVRVVDSLGNEAIVDVAVWPDWNAKGSGCASSGGGNGAAGLLALALLLALRFLPRGRRALARAGLALLALAGVARAQTPTPPTTTEFVVQRFQPSGGAFDVLTVESAQTAGHLGMSVQLWANYANRPLIVVAPGVKDAALLKSQTGLDLALSLGLGDRAEVSLVVPAVVAQSREENRLLPPDLRPSISSSGLGDVRLIPKVRVLEFRALRLGVAVPVSFPTGKKDSYLGHGAITYAPRALVELDGLGPVRVLVNGGAIFREERKLVNLVVGNAYTYGAGLEWGFAQQFSALASFAGEMGMKDTTAAARPMEALGGLRWQGKGGLHLTVGGGPGVGDGYGTPQYRVFAEVGYVTADRHRLDQREPPPKPEPEVVAKKEEPRPEPAREEPKPEPKPEVAKAEPPAEEEVPAPEVVDGELRIDARIYFAFNRKDIKPQFQPVLEQIASRIVAEKRMKMVRIEGHADDLGPPEYNQWLSLERAKAVQAFLIGHGVPAKRVVIVGYGKTHPAEQGKNKTSRAKNRRVEFNVQEH